MYKTRYDNKRIYICRKKGEWQKDNGNIEEYFEDVAFVYKVGISDCENIASVIVDALNAAQQSEQADVNYCYGPNNHLLKDGELCGECGLPKPPRQ